MMTYGEISETILFLQYITEDRRYLNIAYSLLKEMIDNFKIDDESDKVVLKYKLPLGESCSEAMSLEASTYNALKLGVIMNDNNIIETILSHLSLYYMHGTRGGLPINRYCNTGSHDMLHIGHYYGLMKTLWFVERNNLKIKGVDAKVWLEKIIGNLEMHKVEYGYVNILSDRDRRIVNDPGGNVWMFNEGLIPIYYSLVNNKGEFDLDYISKNEYFAGCNFILIDKDKYKTKIQ